MSETAYCDGAYVAKTDVRISPDDRGFLFADAVYEVVRTYGGEPFEMQAHLERLASSLAALRIGGVAVPPLDGVCRELLRRNGLEAADAGIYLQITRGVAPRNHRFPEPAPPPTVYATAWELPPSAPERGIAAVTVPDTRWARCDIKTVGLTANCLASQHAHEAGAEEAIFVRDGVALEGSHTNLFAVVGGRVRTAPLTNYILPGVTRRVVLELCRRQRIPVAERPLLAEDLARADEVFLTGTTTEVTPVVELDGRPVGGGRPGAVALALLDGLRERATKRG